MERVFLLAGDLTMIDSVGAVRVDDAAVIRNANKAALSGGTTGGFTTGYTLPETVKSAVRQHQAIQDLVSWSPDIRKIIEAVEGAPPDSALF